MGIATNVTGLRFGRLIAIDRHRKTHNGHWIWNCKCDCGRDTVVYVTNLVRGMTTSCGCYRIEKSSYRITHGHTRKGTQSLEYESYRGMLSRCLNHNNRKFPDYGGRGIEVCERWVNSFQNFFDDMGIRPSKEHTLDRFPNNDGNYEPANCRWATKPQQNRNRRSNRWYEYNGMRMVATDWARYLNVNECTFREMVKYHSIEYAYNFYRKIS